MTVNIDTVYGDSMEEVRFTITEDGVPVNFNGAAIELRAQPLQTPPGKSGEIIISMSVGSGITITDAAGGKFRIDEQIILAPPGTYDYRIKYTLASGKKKTRITGRWFVDWKGE